MSSSQSFSAQWGLSNLTAPASGVTHSAKWLLAMVGGSPLNLNMLSQMEFLGDFQGQAMMVDNSANTASLTITENTYGWTRIVQAGELRVFQYPGVPNQNFTFTTANNANVTLSVFDWPAFPDSDIDGASGGGTPVVVIGTVSVQDSIAEGYLATLAGISEGGTAQVGSAHTVATGGTAVTVFTNPTKPGGYITNPSTATENLFVDAVHVATTTEGANGTNVALQAGQTMTFPAGTMTVTANAATTGHNFIAVFYG